MSAPWATVSGLIAQRTVSISLHTHISYSKLHIMHLMAIEPLQLSCCCIEACEGLKDAARTYHIHIVAIGRKVASLIVKPYMLNHTRGNTSELPALSQVLADDTI